MKIAFDCRELTRTNLVSLGLVLESIIEHSPYDDLVLLSDIPLDSKYLVKSYKNYYWGQRNEGGGSSLKYHLWMKKFLEKNPVDVLYQVNQYSPVSIKGVKIITQIPDLYTLAGIQKYPLKYILAFKLYIWRTVKNSALIQTVSEFSKKTIMEKFPMSNKIEVNYNGIFAPEDYELAETPIVHGKYFLMLGRMNHWKGTIRVLELFSKYFGDTEFKLVLAGIPEDKEVEKIVGEYTKKYKNIISLGYISNNDRENLYHFAQVLLYASRYDGFGMPPLEAAIRGTKCLMNDISVLREVTHNTGYFVDYYGDDQTVVDMIYKVVNDDYGLTKKMETLARTTYTVKGFVENVYKAAERLCEM